MGYLICDNCNIFYEVDDDFILESFDICEDCGDKLKFYDSFDEYYNEYSELDLESIVYGKGYSENKSFKYKTLMIAGVILGLIGLIGFLAGFIILISLSFVGFILALYGYGSGINWNKGIKGEKIVAENLKQLPKDYFIFNDVKFPGSRGNLDHVVVGPNGVFVIETKNLTGFFVINDKEWLYKKHVLLNVPLKRSISQPGKQVMANTKDLKKFLISNSVNFNDLWINSIVTLIKNNYKIKKKPKHYNIVNQLSLSEFIIKREKQVDPSLLNEIALLIEPYCIELTFGQNQKIEKHNETIDHHDTIDLKDEKMKNDVNQQVVQVNNKLKLPNNGIRREFIVAEYLNQLPKGYFIFNDVKFPGNDLDHVVIGPNGIFVIKTKNYKGFYIVKDEEWFYKNSKKSHGQPGKQVMANSISLRKFLIDNGINMDGVWVNSIVTLLNNNFKIEQKPTRYKVLSPSKIPEFILNHNSQINININILKESAILIGSYCKELSYIRSST